MCLRTKRSGFGSEKPAKKLKGRSFVVAQHGEYIIQNSNDVLEGPAAYMDFGNSDMMATSPVSCKHESDPVHEVSLQQWAPTCSNGQPPSFRPSDDPFDPDCEDTATSSGGSGSTTSRSSSASGAAPHLQQECSSPSPSLTPAAGNTTSSASTSDANSSHQADRQMAFDSASEFEFPFDCVTASSDDSSEEEASLAFGGFAYGSFASVVQASPCHDDGSAFGGFQGFRTPAGAEASQFELAAGSPWSLAPCPAPSPYPAVA